MTRVYVLVEGQTEEVFVRELLQPRFARIGVYLYPILLLTSAGHRGGMVSYAKTRPQIVRLCRQDAVDYPDRANGAAKAVFLEARLAVDIALPNFLPNLMVHEFEALLFTQPEHFAPWVDDDGVVASLREVRRDLAPEDINESPRTAPSKRILAAMPAYQKTVHGPLVAIDIGLDAMRAQCPHFDGWLRELEALAV